MRWGIRFSITTVVAMVAGLTVAVAPVASQDGAPPSDAAESSAESAPEVSPAVTPTLSAPLREAVATSSTAVENPQRRNHLESEPDAGARGTWDRESVPLDPLIAVEPAPEPVRTPDVDLSFAGIGNPVACGTCVPPDPNGDVGPNHYVQMVNATKVQIWDKTGTLVDGPFDLGGLWTSGQCTANRGDPIVLYDPLADRWLLTQFAEPNHMCFAVSETADPTGNYWLYEFDVGEFPDYFKLGVWPDGYYMSANEPFPERYTAYAFDRTSMLAGGAASFQKFDGQTNFMLPSDLDGATPPPAGSPNHFYTFKDNSVHGGIDRVEVLDFSVDWVTPSNSTFGVVASIPVSAFTYTACGFFNLDCIPQGGTAQLVDQIGEWPMWRWPYRNFGTHESMVGTFSVGGGTGGAGSAVRWFELRKVGGGAWTLHQEGTQDLGDGLDRWMSSIAMDSAGNIALGYNASSSATFPSIRYATRLASDPLGTLGTEKVLQAGLGSQTGSNRWGDYAAMTVDPTDDCTFWFTAEYYAATSLSIWSTRIANFVEPTCAGAVAPVANDASFDISEDAAIGTTVGTVTASDANGDPLTFSITGGNLGGAFAIGAASGEITVAAPLDFDATPTYSLTVTVSDGGLSDTATIAIDVLEGTNNAPNAEDATFDVAESVPVGYALGAITATDLDGDPLSFSITGGNVGGAFAISGLGEVSVASGLDYETTPSYSLTVEVSDGALSDTATVTIDVINVFETPTTARFGDVPLGHLFFADVEWLAWAGITKGCNPPANDLFCPDGTVTRAEFAAFMVRALGLTAGVGADLFTDDDGSIFETDIDKLGTSGITKGCDPPDNVLFCPAAPVIRAEFAAFMVRALGLTAGVGADLFTDDDGSIFETDIDKLGTSGITKGCNPPDNDLFCPGSSLTRAQLAAFLHRAEGEINAVRASNGLPPLGS